MTRTRALVSTAALVLLAPAAAAAQTQERFITGVSAGIARTWDDESLLGTGPLTEGRIGWALTPKTQIELDVARVGYERRFDSGVATEGRSIFTGVAVKYDFTRGAVRPFVTAGLGINRHSGTREHPASPLHEASSTDPGYMLGTGIVVRRGRWEIGPEARAYMMTIHDDASVWLMIAGGLRASIRF